MAYLGKDERRFIQEAVRRLNLQIKRSVETRLKKHVIKEMLIEEFRKDGYRLVLDKDGNLTPEGVNDPVLNKILAIMVEGLANQIKFKHE